VRGRHRYTPSALPTKCRGSVTRPVVLPAPASTLPGAVSRLARLCPRDKIERAEDVLPLG
jgi:hypothetical protein